MLFFTSYRRNRYRRRPIPDRWCQILHRNVMLWRRLPPPDRDELQGHIHVFLAEKHFEGGGGFAVTEEMEVTIAAQACTLLLHRNSDYFPRISSIIIYPGEYAAPHAEADAAGIVTEGMDRRSGEAWGGGSIVLSWEDVLWGARHANDGYNVVLHEFAHELDLEDGCGDGTPPFGKRSGFLRWRNVLQMEYDNLTRDLEQGRDTFLDPYAAEDPAEFFAVAVEAFFERPHPMKELHPELYGVLKGYFLQDPADWEDLFPLLQD